MKLVDKIFDFVIDPFGIQKRRDDKAFKEMIKYLHEWGEDYDRALEKGDRYQMQRNLMLMDKADKIFFP